MSDEARYQAGRDFKIGGDLVQGNKLLLNLPTNLQLDLAGHKLPGRNALFVGRADTLADLSRTLDADGALLVLCGYGGLGKTQTAIEFAHRFSAQFPGGCFGIRCDAPLPHSVTQPLRGARRSRRRSLPSCKGDCAFFGRPPPSLRCGGSQ
jgi:hypothetical protein